MNQDFPNGVSGPFASLWHRGSSARGLSNDCYTSQSFFERERSDLFGRTWTCIGVGADIPLPGDCLPVTLLGMPLLMLRDEAGQIRVFHNVCRHRGVTMVEEACRVNRLRCPYHAWTYALDGRLTHTPNIGGVGVHEVDGVARDTLGLAPVRSGQWLDFVFIDLSGELESLEDWLAPLRERWSHYPLDQLRHGGNQEFHIEANWKLATENAMEYYHLPAVHKSLASYSPVKAHYLCNAGDRFVGTATRDYHPAPPEVGPALPAFTGLDETQRQVGEYPIVFPNLWLGVQADHFFAMVVYPLGPALTRQRLHLYFVGDEALAPALDATRAAVLARWVAINQEDIGITEQMQRGRGSPAFDGGVLVDEQDGGGRHFMRMVALTLESTGRRA